VEDISRIFVDTSKSVFQLHGVDAAERVVVRRKLRRAELLGYFAKLSPTVVGLEACGGSHHLARELAKLGHMPRQCPAQYVKAYLKRSKNDARDAEAGCEAMGRPTMRFVPVKSAEEQAGLMLLGVRDRLVRGRTRLGNEIRGYAAEFGLVAPKGLGKLEPLLARIAADAAVPELARELFARLGREYAQAQQEIAALEGRLLAAHRASELSLRLAQIPSVGPIGAMLLVLKAPDPRAFRSGRDFAAWLGLTPKDHSTAGKTRLGGVTKAGDEELRRVLVCGAMALIRQARRPGARPWPWLEPLLAKGSAKLAAVAVANRVARIAWKLMVSGEPYQAGHQPQRPAHAA
jgi:transposase